MRKTTTRSGQIRAQQRLATMRRPQVRYTQAGRRTPRHGHSR